MPGTETIFNGPIPGQSLTQDPAQRGPWEMPPKFNSPNQAIDHLFKVVTSKSFLQNFNHLLMEDKKFYVDELAAGILEEGFLNGLWTVDTLMLLVEPLTIMMVWVACQMDKSPTFSSDTGFEDRTGFEEITDLMVDSIQEIPEDEEEATEPQEVANPTPPVVEQLASESPLVGGGA